MDEIIHIEQQPVAGENQHTVNARELHAFLEVGRDFTTWIKSRVTQYRFEQRVDFLIHRNGGTNAGRGGDRRSLNYTLTLDTAKELAMVERTDKGRQARRYFIECERRLRQHMPAEVPEGLAYFRLLATYENGQLKGIAHIPQSAAIVRTDSKESICQFILEGIRSKYVPVMADALATRVRIMSEALGGRATA